MGILEYKDIRIDKYQNIEQYGCSDIWVSNYMTIVAWIYVEKI